MEKIYKTLLGDIHYWTNGIRQNRDTLVFLPGLTADHRLFDKQIDYFKDSYNIIVWDAPGHAASRPFELTFSLADKARWLYEILVVENVTNPIIVGQSMGGYVGQAFAELYPNTMKGFIVIDSAPLQKKYYSWETWLMENAEFMYKMFPWKLLIYSGSRGVAVSDYGRNLMRDMMLEYNDEPSYYSKLAGFGYKILTKAINANLNYKLNCPVLLICGKKDITQCMSFNKKWSKDAGYRLVMIDDAGHNANTDRPDFVNELIEDFVVFIR